MASSSFKGKSRGFKVYTDNKCHVKTSIKPPMALRKSLLPVRKGVYEKDSTDLLKGCAENMRDIDTSVQVKIGRKALVDVSNTRNYLLRTGASIGSKTMKSLPVKKGVCEKDSGDFLKGCAGNSRKSMNKRDSDSSGQVKGGREALADVTNTKNNLSRTGVSIGSKTIKSQYGKNLFGSRVSVGQSTTTASVVSRKPSNTSAGVPSRKPSMGTTNSVHKNCIEGAYTLKKVGTRDSKLYSESQKTKGLGLESVGFDGRKIIGKPLVPTRKSLPAFEKISQIASNGLKDNEKCSDSVRGKSVKFKVGRKVAPDVWKNRASTSFISVKDRSEKLTLLQGVSEGKNIIDTGGSSGKSLKDIATSSNNRRQSFTSSLLAKSEVTRNEKLPNIDDKGNMLDVSEYIEDIYSYYWLMEAQYPSLSNYMNSQTNITPKMRGILINWLIEVHSKFGLMQETLFLMVAVFDRFVSVVTIQTNEIQLVGLTALLLASKYEDFWHPKVNELIAITDDSYTRLQMLSMEKLILKKLMFRLNTPTPYVFMLRFLKAAQSDKKLEHLAFYLIELCLTEYEALKFRSSLLCASAIYVARCTLQMSPAWTPLLCKHAHYEESELRDCAEMILRFHKASSKGPLKVTYGKYICESYLCVAKIKALHRLPQ